MTNECYFRSLLSSQDLTATDVAALQGLRSKIEGQLSVFEGSPRFYYAGSYGKDTVIKANYDLDIVMYWPHDVGYTLKGIFDAVGTKLKEHWTVVRPKTVAWTLPFDGGFHVDVVPGRALDATFRYANLYRTDTGTSLQTSIKVHIENVRRSGRRDLIRLMKLWKVRRGVPIKSFVLELMAIAGAAGHTKADLEPQLMAAFIYVRDRIGSAAAVDPANSNNDLASSITASERSQVQLAAAAAIRAQSWRDVFE